MTEVHDCCPSRQGIGKGDRKSRSNFHTNRDATVLVVEDVVTTGGQSVLSVQTLRRLDAIVEHAICVIDRESGGREALMAAGVKLTPLFQWSELAI